MEEYKKFIPKKFKEKYETLDEISVKTIDQKSLENMKNALSKLLKNKLKLVGMKFQFISEEGILIEQGATADGFDEKDWDE